VKKEEKKLTSCPALTLRNPEYSPLPPNKEESDTKRVLMPDIKTNYILNKKTQGYKGRPEGLPVLSPMPSPFITAPLAPYPPILFVSNCK
jgi:hypothetical protein